MEGRLCHTKMHWNTGIVKYREFNRGYLVNMQDCGLLKAVINIYTLVSRSIHVAGNSNYKTMERIS